VFRNSKLLGVEVDRKPTLREHLKSNGRGPGENRQLVVTHEPVEVQDFRRSTNHFGGIYGIYLKFILHIEKPKDVNMQPVGFANTRISTDEYAQKSPRSLLKSTNQGSRGF
jgi:hypothetical protein